MLRYGKKGNVVRNFIGRPYYFRSKEDAKTARQFGQVVSYGPDHKLYKGE